MYSVLGMLRRAKGHRTVSTPGSCHLGVHNIMTLERPGWRQQCAVETSSSGLQCSRQGLVVYTTLSPHLHAGRGAM